MNYERAMYKFILYWIAVLSRFLAADWIPPPINLANYDAYGSLITMNEQLIILAQNDIRHFQIVVDPFTNHSCRCAPRYIAVQHGINSFADYIYSVAIGSKQEKNETNFYFAFIDEDQFRNVFLTIVYFYIALSPSICVYYADHFDFNVTDLAFSEQVIIAMDPNGTRVYAVGFHHTVIIDIKTKVDRIYHKNDVFGLGLIGPPPLGLDEIHVFSKAMFVSEDHRLYLVGQRHYNFQYLAYLHVLDYSDLDHNRVRLISVNELSAFNFGTAAQRITRFSAMSIHAYFDEEEKIIIIGIPHVDIILLLSFNRTHSPVIIKRHESVNKGVGFGKSVAFFHDHTYAVLAHGQSTLPWSTSQVQIYSVYDESNQPLFVFPNNQQTIPTMNLIQPPYGILTLVSYDMNVGLVVEAGGFLLLPASSPGYCSSQIGDHLLYAGNYISLPCPIGTASNTTSFGPCFICPPKTKNNGSSGMNCEVCSSNESLLCLRGTKMEVEWNKLSSFNQANPYPDSPETKEFDDVLLQNVFKFGTLSSHCLFISPLFWATLAIGFSFIVVIIMGILAFYPKRKPHRTFVQKIFTRIDLIGHGELWLGGLVSVVLIILIGFTCKFSISFSNLYPIEIISASTHSSVICDPNLINAKFTSALQLLSIHKHDEEEPIFQLLDEQQIVLTTQFVSTEFQCEHVTMQRNMDKGQQTLSSDFNCTTDNESNIVSVSTLLPQHLIVVQFSLTGSSFVGGLRICFNGPSTSQSNGKYTIQMLNFCRFFFTTNETLT
ncbi:unnamed protein product, partial [Rotaria sp. Silwood1]